MNNETEGNEPVAASNNENIEAIPSEEDADINEPALPSSPMQSQSDPSELEPPLKRSRQGDDCVDYCPICLEGWSTSGDHRICCLKCGHLFGYSCLRRWLDSQKLKKTCPTCNSKVAKYDIRYLYVTKINCLYNDEIVNLKKEVENLKKQNNSYQIAHTKDSQYISALKEKLLSTEHQLKVLKQQSGMYSETSRSTSTTAVCGSQSKLFKDKSMLLNSEGGCRVMDSNAAKNLVVVSTTSTNPLFAKYGIKKVDVTSCRTVGFLPLHNQIIRDIKFHKNNKWYLTVSVDKMLKIVDHDSNAIITNFSNSSPMWSCCWHNSDEYALYVGEQQGSVTKFDLRRMYEPLNKLTVNNDSSPVLSIASMRQDKDIKEGLLVCKLNSLFYFERVEDYVLNYLPIDGPFVSMNYDESIQQILLALRPNSSNRYTKYTIGQLERREEILNFNTIHDIDGQSTTQRVLSRSCFVKGNPQCFAAFQESVNSLNLWDIKTGQHRIRLPAAETVLDLNYYESHCDKYLFALTEKKLEFLKFT